MVAAGDRPQLDDLGQPRICGQSHPAWICGIGDHEIGLAFLQTLDASRSTAIRHRLTGPEAVIGDSDRAGCWVDIWSGIESLSADLLNEAAVKHAIESNMVSIVWIVKVALESVTLARRQANVVAIDDDDVVLTVVLQPADVAVAEDDLLAIGEKIGTDLDPVGA
ncbi:MAG: hypothetical protein AW11_01352 [Candidatus Accumulibacter regalis]|uniref:Uncharacterized protein n=1 Tax=Accumulibacter regalis TaxID=522306 RepID=A0A011REM1_ACCRE|nr:MAG: hypothetical protein AW11_01352 [Candidatus Accumulibacter regalis]